MDSSLILSNVLNSPVLFFVIGLTAVFLKSDLEIPQSISTLFFVYLLFAISFNGGDGFYESGLSSEVAIALRSTVVVVAVVSVYSFFILRLKLDLYNASAIAAIDSFLCAVTFVTASSFLSPVNVDVGNYLVATLALMSSPAMIMGLLSVRVFVNRLKDKSLQDTLDWGECFSSPARMVWPFCWWVVC